MRTRSGAVLGDNGEKRKAPEGDDNGRGKRRLVQRNEQKNDPPREENGRGKRKLVQSNEQRKGKILRGIRGCVSPRCSAYTYRSRFSWYFLPL